MGEETETKVLQCRAGQVYGTKEVKVKVDLSTNSNFTIICPEKGCLAMVVVDYLASQNESRSARCAQINCSLSPYHQEH